jgi:hypothetical protein
LRELYLGPRPVGEVYRAAGHLWWYDPRTLADAHHRLVAKGWVKMVGGTAALAGPDAVRLARFWAATDAFGFRRLIDLPAAVRDAELRELVEDEWRAQGVPPPYFHEPVPARRPKPVAALPPPDSKPSGRRASGGRGRK